MQTDKRTDSSALMSNTTVDERDYGAIETEKEKKSENNV